MASLLLVGKTGCGKSSTGNSILGRRVFEALTSATSVTKTVQYDYAVVNEREVKVVDGPGLLSTDCPTHESALMVCQEIEKAILISPDGYDAILIVTDMARFTKEDREVIRQLKSTFGEDFVEKFCILVVTHADDYDPKENGKSFEDWCDDQTGSFNEIKKECHDRIVPFFNKTKDEKIKKNQVDRLFQFVDQIRSKHGCYNKGLFEAARNIREHMLVKLKEPLLMEETEQKIRIRMQELQQIDEIDKKLAVQKLEELKSEISSVLEEVQAAEQGTDALASVKCFVHNFLQQIDNKMESLRSSLLMKEKMEKIEYGFKKEHEQNLETIEKLEEEIKKLKEKEIKMKEEMADKMKSLEDEYKVFKEKQLESRFINVFNLFKTLGETYLICRNTSSFIQIISNALKKQ